MSLTFSPLDINGRIISVDEERYFNVSNANGCRLLRYLGYEQEADNPWDLDGINAAELISRIDNALALIQNFSEFDDGVPVQESRGDGGCLMIDCGTRPGYFAERLPHLREIAVLAGHGKVIFY